MKFNRSIFSNIFVQPPHPICYCYCLHQKTSIFVLNKKNVVTISTKFEQNKLIKYIDKCCTRVFKYSVQIRVQIVFDIKFIFDHCERLWSKELICKQNRTKTVMQEVFLLNGEILKTYRILVFLRNLYCILD